MTINQMQQFYAVSRLGSVTRAAEELHISQPSISNSIIQLENEFGVSLFLRTNKQMILTDAGKFFSEHVAILLQQTSRLEEQMKDIGVQKNKVLIGISSIMGTVLMPALLAGFRSYAPETHLEIWEKNSTQIQNLVETDMVDVGIINTKSSLGEQFAYRLINSTELLFCVHKSHPLASYERVSPKDIENCPLIVPSLNEEAFQKRILAEYGKKHAFKPQFSIESAQVYTTSHYLADGLHGAFLYRELAGHFPNIRFIPMEEPIKIEVGLIWRKDRSLFPDVKRFIAYMEEVFIPSRNKAVKKEKEKQQTE